MHRPHLALSNRPEPEALARRWFSYVMIGVASLIIGIVALLSLPDPQAKMNRQQIEGGTRAPVRKENAPNPAQGSNALPAKGAPNLPAGHPTLVPD